MCLQGTDILISLQLPQNQMLHAKTTSCCPPLPPRQLLQTSLSLGTIPKKQQDNFSNKHAYSHVIQAVPELHEHVHGVLRLALHLLLSTVTSIAHTK